MRGDTTRGLQPEESHGPKIVCLDHGYIRRIDFMGSDLSIVRAARVSHNADWRAGENQGGDRRLINYLMENDHTTPFEAVFFTFEVSAPIFDFRQWHRHRTQSYNEVSARYTELPEVFYVPKVEHIGMQMTKNKQARSFKELEPGEKVQREEEVAVFKMHCEQAFTLYRRLLALGWPRELARAVLPMGTYSRMFLSGNLLNLFRFLTLRVHSHAQYEIRVYAQAMAELIQPVVPYAYEAWRKKIERMEENKKVISVLKELRDLAEKHRIGSDLGAMVGGPDGDRITELENQLEALVAKL